MGDPVRSVAVAVSVAAVTGAEATLPALIHWLDAHPGPWRLPPGELSLALLSEEALADLHGRFLDDPSPTDVITFPGDPDDDFAGEICLSAERAHDEATCRREPFARELTLYVIHGWLHLCGLDDRTEPDRDVMRAAEARLLSDLEAADRLPAVRWQPAS